VRVSAGKIEGKLDGRLGGELEGRGEVEKGVAIKE
jgi:hypothetical protein